jgi:hypothetical protein
MFLPIFGDLKKKRNIDLTSNMGSKSILGIKIGIWWHEHAVHSVLLPNSGNLEHLSGSDD